MKKTLFIILFLLSISFCFGEVDFDGVDDYVDTNSRASMDGATAYTWSVWVKPDDTTWTVDVAVLGSMNGQFNQCLIWGDAGFDEWQAYVEDPDVDIIKIEDEGNAAPSGNWEHICVTFDGDPGTLTMYVNGVQAGTDTNADVDEIYTYSGAEALWIGDDDEGATNNEFDGKITEVACWNVVLTANEITSLAKARVKGLPLQIQRSNLKAYYPLDDEVDGTSGDGDTFVDRSGNGNDATGVDGANNTGLTCYGESYLSYPPN